MLFDGWFPTSDPSLPNFGSLACLYFGILFSSVVIAFDWGKLKRGKKVRMAEGTKFETIAMIGCGSMGGSMALLFSEIGVNVSLSDPSESTMDNVIKQAEESGYHNRIHKYNDYKKLCNSLSTPRLLIFSLPHGSVGDKVLEGLTPYLSRGDIILDCGNEHFENTERRQQKSEEPGIRYIGCGVSGGYQAARAGPSMCPSGDIGALKEVMPLLQKVAAKDKDGNPCVGIVGKGGSGHYVKMMHNGIEHGMMSAICEAWGIMRQMGMGYEQVGDILKEWNENGQLKGTFLISIGADLSHKRDKSTGSYSQQRPLLISEVLDKVVQDVTGEEGTGIWSNTEAIELHVPAFTLNVSHALRLASAYRGEREKANTTADGGFPPHELDIQDKEAFIEDLRKATYVACLASFIQGLNVIERANKTHEWDIDYSAVLQIWKAGCIIQSDYISNEILAPALTNPSKTNGSMNLLYDSRTARDVRDCYPSLRRVVAKAIETDQVAPALSASLEYFKIVTGTDLPTSFYEAELDYFGSHMFDKKGDKGVKGPTEGQHHFEWKPARSQKEVYGNTIKL